MAAATFAAAAATLAEAFIIQEVDGLISDMESLKSQPHTCITTNERILSLVEELGAHLEELRSTIDSPDLTVAFLSEWLEPMQITSKSERRKGELLTNGETHSLTSRLEAEKESLILQVSVLVDQVEVQGEKIRDLEFTKKEMQIKLEEAEQLLQSETLKSCNLLNENTELVIEVSSLKIALNQKSASDLTEGMEQYETLFAEQDMGIERLKDHIEFLLDEQEKVDRSHQAEGLPSTTLKSQLREKASKVNHLKMEVETLAASCKEKDQLLQEAQQSILKFKRIEEMLMRVNQWIGCDGSLVVSLDSMDSSREDMLMTPSSTSSPEPYPSTPTHCSRPLLTERQQIKNSMSAGMKLHVYDQPLGLHVDGVDSHNVLPASEVLEAATKLPRNRPSTGVCSPGTSGDSSVCNFEQMYYQKLVESKRLKQRYYQKLEECEKLKQALAEANQNAADRGQLLYKNAVQNVAEELDLACSICKKFIMVEPAMLPCSHSFCKSCITRWLRKYKKKTCPKCRETCKSEIPVPGVKLLEPLLSLIARACLPEEEFEEREKAAAQDTETSSYSVQSDGSSEPSDEDVFFDAFEELPAPFMENQESEM